MQDLSLAWLVKSKQTMTSELRTTALPPPPANTVTIVYFLDLRSTAVRPK